MAIPKRATVDIRSPAGDPLIRTRARQGPQLDSFSHFLSPSLFHLRTPLLLTSSLSRDSLAGPSQLNRGALRTLNYSYERGFGPVFVVVIPHCPPPPLSPLPCGAKTPDNSNKYLHF